LNIQELIFRIRDQVALNPWLITVAMVVGGVLLIAFLVVRKARKNKAMGLEYPEPSTPGAREPRYDFRLCIIGEKHRWIQTFNSSMTFTFTDPDPPQPTTPLQALFDGRAPNTYDINPTVLYELAPSLFQKLGMVWDRVDTLFLVVFNEGKNEPVNYQAPKRSAYVLKTIQESQALSKAFKKEFAGEFSVKKMFIYAVILIVGILAYMIISGQLVI
jgi:hypothetical protein